MARGVVKECTLQQGNRDSKLEENYDTDSHGQSLQIVLAWQERVHWQKWSIHDSPARTEQHI